MLILVSGGSASGKSEFAESLVLQSGCDRRYYLATMIPYDEECRRRISRHRKMRAAKGFKTIEVPVGLFGVHRKTMSGFARATSAATVSASRVKSSLRSTCCHSAPVPVVMSGCIE